eukprot:6181555-Pleurochrysis_carterae.AAC.5
MADPAHFTTPPAAHLLCAEFLQRVSTRLARAPTDLGLQIPRCAQYNSHSFKVMKRAYNLCSKRYMK